VCADILQALLDALQSHTGLAATVCGALARLPLSPPQRARAVAAALNHVNSVPADQVPDVALFALLHCAPDRAALSICQVLPPLTSLRCSAALLRRPCVRLLRVPCPLSVLNVLRHDALSASHHPRSQLSPCRCMHRMHLHATHTTCALSSLRVAALR
jgi:hypothetical protein